MTTDRREPGAGAVIGVDTGAVALPAADHALRRLADALGGVPDGLVACTHLIRTAARQGTALSLALPDREAAERMWAALPAALAALHEDAGAAWDERGYGPAELTGAAALAAAEHAGRTGGRAVLYPGADSLTGTVTVARILAGTAIEAVTVVGAPAADPATPVLTRDFVRPEWRAGHLTLALAPAPGGHLAPFEVPNPTPCCADHG
jgi:hypothetical protein